jgi:hypothetical protein
MVAEPGPDPAILRLGLWTERNCGQAQRHLVDVLCASGGIHVPGRLRCEIVEGHRYADDAEPSWYSGRNQYDPSTSGSHAVGSSYDSGVHERPSGAFRLPEQRPSAPYSAAPDASTTGTRIPVRGPEYPTVRPTSEPAPAPALSGPPPQQQAVAGPTSLVPPVTERSRQPESVYQSRRPVSAVIVGIVMVVLAVPVVRLLIDSTFTGDPTARGIVPAVLLALGFALTGIGLFSVARGGPTGRDAWLRPPVAYLPAGLLLLVAAGLAVA